MENPHFRSDIISNTGASSPALLKPCHGIFHAHLRKQTGLSLIFHLKGNIFSKAASVLHCGNCLDVYAFSGVGLEPTLNNKQYFSSSNPAKMRFTVANFYGVLTFPFSSTPWDFFAPPSLASCSSLSLIAPPLAVMSQPLGLKVWNSLLKHSLPLSLPLSCSLNFTS